MSTKSDAPAKSKFPIIITIALVLALFGILFFLQWRTRQFTSSYSSPKLAGPSIIPSTEIQSTTPLLSSTPTPTPTLIIPHPKCRKFTQSDIEKIRKEILAQMAQVKSLKKGVTIIYPVNYKTLKNSPVRGLIADPVVGPIGIGLYDRARKKLYASDPSVATLDLNLFDDHTLKRWLPKKIEAIADIGTGLGHYIFIYANTANKVFAVEVDPNSLLYLHEMISKFDREFPDCRYGDRMVLVRGLIKDVCLPPESCDVIMVLNVHLWVTRKLNDKDSEDVFLKSKKEFFDSMIYALKSGGRLIVADGHLKNNNFHYSMSQVKEHMSKLYVKRGTLKFVGEDETWRSPLGFLICYEKP